MSTELAWQAVSPAYKQQLRLRLTGQVLVLLLAITAAAVLIPEIPVWLGGLAGAVALLGWLLLVILWVPRRYRVTRYASTPDSVHFQVGALWLSETAVPCNRLQHLELEEGPVERQLGIQRLVLYTAGGTGADLTIPGLARADARALRQQLLDFMEHDRPTDEAITRAGSAEHESH